jgi:hypothetical protein
LPEIEIEACYAKSFDPKDTETKVQTQFEEMCVFGEHFAFDDSDRSQKGDVKEYAEIVENSRDLESEGIGEH